MEERAAGAHTGFRDEVADARIEVALTHEQRPTCVDEVATRRLAACPTFSSVPPLFAMPTILATFMLYVACMADDEVRAYGRWRR